MTQNNAPEFDPTIDVNKLDEEWLGQPKFYHTYATKLVKARLRDDEAKQKLALVSAEIDASVREAPENFGLTKITEATVAGAIIQQKYYKVVLDEYNKAKYKVGMLAAAVGTLDQRRKALENLVDLHGMDYFSEPRAKSIAGREAMEDATIHRGRKRVETK